MPVGILDFIRQRAQNLTSTIGKDLGQFQSNIIHSFGDPVRTSIQQGFRSIQQNPNSIYQNPFTGPISNAVRNQPLTPSFFPKQFRGPTIGQVADFSNPPPSPAFHGYMSKFGKGGFTPEERQSGNEAQLNLMMGMSGGASKLGSEQNLNKAYQALNHHWSAVIGNAGRVFSRGELGNVVETLTKERPNSTNEVFRNEAIKIAHYIKAAESGVTANAPVGMAAQSIRSKADEFIQGLEKDAQESMDRMSPVEHRPTQIEINAQEAQTAEVNTIAGNMGKGGFRGFGKDLQNNFSDWVNGRNAAEFKKYASFKKWDPIINPDKKIMDTFQDPQEKITNFLGKLGAIKNDPNSPIRQFFNKRGQDALNAGYKMGWKQDYFPQLWGDPPEKVAQVMGDRTLGLKPSFTFKSIIKDYEEGIAKGLTPRFTNVAELTGWYDGQVQRAVADKNFFQTLAKNSFLRPASQSPLGWKSLDPDLFPKVKVSFPNATGQVEYSGTYKAPPELADVINGYLRAPNNKLNSFANVATKLKNFILENGVPGTGVNFHGVNILVRSAMAGNDILGIPGTGLIKGGTQAFYYLINPNAAQREIDSNLERASFAISKGLKLDVEDQVFGKKTGIMGRLFQVPLFQKVIPGLKIKAFNTIYDNLTKSIDSDTAAREATKIVNNIYGGINWEQFGRSRQTQALIRSIVFAPDFQESNLGIGKGIIKSLLDPTNPLGGQYRQITRNLFYMYVGANLLNHHTSGKWIWQNDPGHEFDVQVGFTDTGQKRYFRPFGTAADFIRIPVDVVASLVKGDTKTLRSTIANRVSVPLSAGARFALNIDEFGRPITGAGDTVINSVANLAQTLIPQYGSAATRFLSGQQSGEQSLAQAFGLPLRYAGGASTVVEKRVATYLKKQGASGKEIGGVIQYYKDHGVLDKAYTAYNTDTTKGPDFMKSFKKTAQSDKVVGIAWDETAQYANSNPQLTDDQIIQFGKKRLDYYNKQVDKTYNYPAQYIEDQKSAQNIQKMSPKEQKTLRNRLRKGR